MKQARVHLQTEKGIGSMIIGAYIYFNFQPLNPPSPLFFHQKGRGAVRYFFILAPTRGLYPKIVLNLRGTLNLYLT